MPDLISVVIPNYGHRHYLMDSVQSILNQTWQDFEIFILNDDEQPLMEYEKLDNRIRVFDRVDGVRHTSEWRLNNIVDELSGYWCYQDADGTSYPGRLARSYEFLNVSDSDIITTDGIYIFAQLFFAQQKYVTKDTDYGVGAMSSVFSRKEVLARVPFSKEGYGSDGPWWYEIKYQGLNYAHLELPLYVHLDYSSRFRKYKSIPVLRKLYRLAVLKPELNRALKQLKHNYGHRFDNDYGEV